MNYVINFFRRLKENFKARMRGEIPLVNPTSKIRGRIYESKISGYQKPTGANKAKAKANIVLDLKVTRADGSVEYINGLDAEMKEDINNG